MIESARDEARFLGTLERQPVVIDEIDPPNVYSRAEIIDRAEAERMLTFLLEARYRIRQPKFRWARTGKPFLQPVVLKSRPDDGRS